MLQLKDFLLILFEIFMGVGIEPHHIKKLFAQLLFYFVLNLLVNLLGGNKVNVLLNQINTHLAMIQLLDVY